VKQASLACGVDVLSVTGVLFGPVRQAVAQVCDSVQLFPVARWHEYSIPLLQPSMTDPPHTIPSYGAPWTFVALQLCTSALVSMLVSGSAGSASSPHPGAMASTTAQTSAARAMGACATGFLAGCPRIDRSMFHLLRVSRA
jgi:hypothetical protein